MAGFYMKRNTGLKWVKGEHILWKLEKGNRKRFRALDKDKEALAIFSSSSQAKAYDMHLPDGTLTYNFFNNAHISDSDEKFKAYVHYFLSNFYFFTKW